MERIKKAQGRKSLSNTHSQPKIVRNTGTHKVRLKGKERAKKKYRGKNNLTQPHKIRQNTQRETTHTN